MQLKSLLPGVNSGPHEVRLIDDLMANYNSYERPAENDNDNLKVEFMVTLRNIIDVVCITGEELYDPSCLLEILRYHIHFMLLFVSVARERSADQHQSLAELCKYCFAFKAFG